MFGHGQYHVNISRAAPTHFGGQIDRQAADDAIARPDVVNLQMGELPVNVDVLWAAQAMAWGYDLVKVLPASLPSFVGGQRKLVFVSCLVLCPGLGEALENVCQTNFLEDL